MRPARIALISFGLLLAPFAFSLAEEDDEEEVELDWKSDFEEALKSARLAKMPIFVQIVRVGNGDCNRMKRTFRDPKVVEEFLDNCVLARLDGALLKTGRMLTKYRIKGTGLPFMILFGIDLKVKTQYGGYLDSEEFLKIFKPMLAIAAEAPERSPGEVLSRNPREAAKRRTERYYKTAIELLKEAIAAARKLKAKSRVRDLEEDLGKLDKWGIFEISEAKKLVQNDKNQAAKAIGIIKRVKIDFAGRSPEKEADAALEELRKDAGIAALVDSTEALPEGYEELLEFKKPDPKEKKPKRPKNLIRLKFKDGRELLGNRIGQSGDKMFFKIYDEDPKKRKSDWYKIADIESQEKIEE